MENFFSKGQKKAASSFTPLHFSFSLLQSDALKVTGKFLSSRGWKLPAKACRARKQNVLGPWWHRGTVSSLLTCLLLEWHSLLKSVMLGFSHFQLNIILTHRIHMKVCLKSCLRWSVVHRTSLISWDLHVSKHLCDWKRENPELRDRLFYFIIILSLDQPS